MSRVSDVSENDLADLRASLRALLEQASPESTVREVMAGPDGVDRELWRTLARDLDVVGLAVPDQFGGAGAGWVAQRVVLEELGRSLACVPALSVIGLGIPALLAAGDGDALDAFLPAVLRGDSIVTAALLGGSPEVTSTAKARRAGGGWSLTGELPHVLDGHVADFLLVLGEHEAGVGLYAIDARAEGVAVSPTRTSDLTRRMAAVRLDNTPARLLAGPDDGQRIAGAVRPQALLALACEQSGGASAALDQAVTYAGQRVQFGRAIGSFQAVKHRLAELLVAIEECRSATWATARALDSEAADATLVAYATAAVCAAAYVRAASGNVQVHGGIGYTWEHPAHLHVKRSRGSAALLGTPAEHRSRLAQLLPLLARTPGATTTDQAPLRAPEGAMQ